jgi:hypothetical protein
MFPSRCHILAGTSFHGYLGWEGFIQHKLAWNRIGNGEVRKYIGYSCYGFAGPSLCHGAQTIEAYASARREGSGMDIIMD